MDRVYIITCQYVHTNGCKIESVHATLESAIFQLECIVGEYNNCEKIAENKYATPNCIFTISGHIVKL